MVRHASDQPRRYTLLTVPRNNASRSPWLACAVNRLNAFQPLLYGYEPLSTGKLLSNMHRFAPNSSMQVCIHGFHASASCVDDGGRSPFSKSKPLIRIPSPPTLTYTLGSCASLRMDWDQLSNTSFRLSS